MKSANLDRASSRLAQANSETFFGNSKIILLSTQSARNGIAHAAAKSKARDTILEMQRGIILGIWIARKGGAMLGYRALPAPFLFARYSTYVVVTALLDPVRHKMPVAESGIEWLASALNGGIILLPMAMPLLRSSPYAPFRRPHKRGALHRH